MTDTTDTTGERSGSGKGLGDAAGTTLSRRLHSEAARLGFGLVGVADSGPTPHGRALERWLSSGYHGGMEYLARADSVRRRQALDETLSTVRSVVVVGHEYYHEDDPARAADPSQAVVARYARGRDYHEVVHERLTELLAWLDATVDGGARGRVYVDTGPILERDLAQRAGLGWFGRNTMLIHPRRGSYYLLGVILVDVELSLSEPVASDHCGTCTACLDACPTGALLGRDETGSPVIDARRCISYLTIELKGAIPEELRPMLGNRVFGCDICQEVCPWNGRFATPTDEPEYQPRPDLDQPSLLELTERLLAMSEKQYQREFRGSPLARPRRKGMLRNLCVALGNWVAADARAIPDVVPLLRRAARDPQELVREHARWALERVVGLEGEDDSPEAM